MGFPEFGQLTLSPVQVWDLQTLALRARLTGHDSAVLALQLVPERNWLISSSGAFQPIPELRCGGNANVSLDQAMALFA